MVRLEREGAVKLTNNRAHIEHLKALGYVVVSGEVPKGKEPAPERKEAKTAEADKGYTVAELKEKLKAAGVSFPSTANKAMLEAICETNGVI